MEREAGAQPLFLPGGKWVKHQLLQGAAGVQEHLPETELYSAEQLAAFLARHPVVFVKPDLGRGGRSVFRLQQLEQGAYRVQLETERRELSTLEEVHNWIAEVAQERRFLIQQGIDLVMWQGRPVDIRTILQRNERRAWEVTGTFCKLAGKRLAVTNVCHGGRALQVKQYLKGVGYHLQRRRDVYEGLVRLSLAVAERLNVYQNATYGLDIGLDQEGRLWLIEVNTQPSIAIFRELGQPRMYRRSIQLWMLNRQINHTARTHSQKRGDPHQAVALINQGEKAEPIPSEQGVLPLTPAEADDKGTE